MRPGSFIDSNGCGHFNVWAPLQKEIQIQLEDPDTRSFALEPHPHGYFKGSCPNLSAGSHYTLILQDGTRIPDPASRHQPEGVFGPSAVIHHGDFKWRALNWPGLPLKNMIIYECHVGTFTTEGTFQAMINRLPVLKDLGITAIEIMPVAAFPGTRNWGYDGVFPYAVQESYGGPAGLKNLIDQAHQLELAVILDVVYNHLGPEGCVLHHLGPYFTDRYHTPWGKAINFDGPESRAVRDFFIQNAMMWFRDYHIDGLRLDAIQTIFDQSNFPFLAELSRETDNLAKELDRPCTLIAESDLNDRRIYETREEQGMELHGGWLDDWHHAWHAFLTGEKIGHYRDFGKLEDCFTVRRDAHFYQGDYSAYRGRNHGSKVEDIDFHRFVIFMQNHDQIGNRMHGERLSSLIDFETLKCAAAATLLSPFTPLLFMGEEYGESAPFLFFADHEDPELKKGVRHGRQQEGEAYGFPGRAPDPYALKTFQDSCLKWEQGFASHKGKIIWQLTRYCISLRQKFKALTQTPRDQTKFFFNEDKQILGWFYSWKDARYYLMINLSKERKPWQVFKNSWSSPARLLLQSSVKQWGGDQEELKERLTPGAIINLPPSTLLFWSS